MLNTYFLESTAPDLKTNGFQNESPNASNPPLELLVQAGNNLYFSFNFI